MERSFSHLLRTSRLATYDQNIKQIYTSPAKAKRIGDWGLKRNLPTVLRTHHLNIEQLDTAEHQTPFTSAASDYLFIERWKENFPRSRPPQQQPISVKKDLATMSEHEFQRLIDAARKKRAQWKKALANGDLRSDDHLPFMNIQSRYSRAWPGMDTATSQASVGVSSSSASSSIHSAGSSIRTKVGPTYGFFEPSSPTVVQGRVLGRNKTNQMIGVCGVVGVLSSIQSTHLHNTSSKSLQSYYVHKAEFDADGRPNVNLGLTSPGYGTWFASGNGRSVGGGDDYYNDRRLPKGAVSGSNIDMDRRKPSAAVASDRGVISRVQDLLESRDKPTTRA
ncbi:hypothetical protein BG004_007404 [Podila humilis]|nr:hypothetical protein BG004_007404 [Podila humilis]